MEKKIEDYLHLYLGCGIMNGIDDTVRELRASNLDTYKYTRVGKPIPILRPLSSMTKEEKKDIYKLIFGKEFPASGTIFYRPDKTLSSEPRYILTTGVDRVGIEMNGTVWADCDLQNYKHNQHEITLYLLSRHFDLFNLIKSGIAITQ